jgi:folylpolyglutamate synthase/dihydropteroate synthase
MTKLDLEIVIKIQPIMGRMEIYNNFTIDTAHNSQAIKHLIRQNRIYNKIIIGLLKDKKIKEIIRELPKQSEILACNLDAERGAPASQLLKVCKTLDYKCKEFNSVKDAIQYAEDEKTLIVGSFYTVSAARRCFQLEGHREL